MSAGATPQSLAAAKLAAGRKKLEEFKLRKKAPAPESAPDKVPNGTGTTTPPQPNAPASDDDDGGGGESADERVSSPEFHEMKRRLRLHSQTVEFLVGEKSALAARTGELEARLASARGREEELAGQLERALQRAAGLEAERAGLRLGVDELRAANERLRATDAERGARFDDLREELHATKLLVDDRVAEGAELRRRLDEATFRANASELRLQQLGRAGPAEDGEAAETDRRLRERVAALTRQLAELETERSQSNVQYQQYVQQLNNQLESMSQKYETLLSENENLMNRESNLIQQMDSLEKQLQNTMRAETESNEASCDNEQLQNLLKETESENSKLKVSLEEKEQLLQQSLAQNQMNAQHIEELNGTVHLLQSEKPDITKLNAANESDRIAAQKATTQNTKLKTELESLEEAYKKMTDSKLELAELLQAEKNLTKTLTLTLASNEEKLKETHSKLLAKDEEMIRLQAESSELEKEALKHAQIVDRLNHYEAQNQSSDLLQNELEFARNMLRTKDDEIEKLKKLIVVPTQNGAHDVTDSSDALETDIITESSPKPNATVVEDGRERQNPIVPDATRTAENCRHIPAPEAMKKLQDRFTKLMEDVASLSDDKQRLEHLVLQLQGETETIGEYIALYQRQRSILKQREYEKDIQLNQLSQEKQQMKEQLDQLNVLIEQLIRESVNKNILAPSRRDGDERHEEETAGRIMHLLTEIKSSHLIDPETSGKLDNFHPCPWCSGNLITV